MAAVEREIPAWQWIRRPPAFCGVAAEGQDRFDICFLGQKNVWTWLDRIVKAQRRAKVWIIG